MPAAQFADGIAHWIALHYLQRDRFLDGDLKNDFVRSLVSGNAAKRVAGFTVLTSTAGDLRPCRNRSN